MKDELISLLQYSKYARTLGASDSLVPLVLDIHSVYFGVSDFAS
jgi:hypothetical protein